MTDTPDTIDTPEVAPPEPPAPDEQLDDGHDDELGDDPQDGPGREAAKYRRRLRDTEAERDTLAGQVQTLQRAEAERLAADVLAVPADLWLTDTDLETVLTDGMVDADKVTALAEQITGTRPGLAVPALDLGQGARGPAGSSPVTWTQVLQPVTRR